MEIFEYSPQGYNLAKQWLKYIGREDILTKGFSTDGWSVVHAANVLVEKENGKSSKTNQHT
jgi:hypothetical protein